MSALPPKADIIDQRIKNPTVFDALRKFLMRRRMGDAALWSALVYRHMAGVRCSTNKIAPGVDLKGDGGFVIWWPQHGSG